MTGNCFYTLADYSSLLHTWKSGNSCIYLLVKVYRDQINVLKVLTKGRKLSCANEFQGDRQTAVIWSRAIGAERCVWVWVRAQAGPASCVLISRLRPLCYSCQTSNNGCLPIPWCSHLWRFYTHFKKVRSFDNGPSCCLSIFDPLTRNRFPNGFLWLTRDWSQINLNLVSILLFDQMSLVEQAAETWAKKVFQYDASFFF